MWSIASFICSAVASSRLKRAVMAPMMNMLMKSCSTCSMGENSSSPMLSFLHKFLYARSMAGIAGFLAKRVLRWTLVMSKVRRCRARLAGCSCSAGGSRLAKRLWTDEDAAKSPSTGAGLLSGGVMWPSSDIASCSSCSPDLAVSGDWVEKVSVDDLG